MQVGPLTPRLDQRPRLKHDDEPPDEVAFVLPTTVPRDEPAPRARDDVREAGPSLDRSGHFDRLARQITRGETEEVDGDAVVRSDVAAEGLEVLEGVLDEGAIDVDVSPPADDVADAVAPDADLEDVAPRRTPRDHLQARGRIGDGDEVTDPAPVARRERTTKPVEGPKAEGAPADPDTGRAAIKDAARTPVLSGPAGQVAALSAPMLLRLATLTSDVATRDGELTSEPSLDGALDLAALGLGRHELRPSERVMPVEPGRPIAEQVADAVKKLASDAAGDGVIRVRGGAAGDFTAHVHHDGMQLSLRLVADGAMQRATLSERLPEVRDALLRAGFQLEQLDVQTSDRRAPRRDPSRPQPDDDASDGVEFVL